MARPRTISDEDLLDAARDCITEHGPGVSLSVLSGAIGLSPPALMKRFGSKAQLVFRALLPRSPPRWRHTLDRPPGPAPQAELAAVLVELCQGFEAVGPALAALRMSPVDVDRVFPPDQPTPARLARAQLATWLRATGVVDGVVPLADSLVGAAEARGFLRWIGAQMVDPTPDEAWALALAQLALAQREPTPR